MAKGYRSMRIKLLLYIEYDSSKSNQIFVAGENATQDTIQQIQISTKT